ncbi:MAG: putative ABC transporter permease [Ruminococcus sp.]|nr:putative ABC transporter permease [Ruminococcus sp.]
MKLSRYAFVFLMGFFLYGFVEVTGRGYTHWTMCITGGIVLAVIYTLSNRPAASLKKTCLIGTAVITLIEFAVGIFDNIIMGWQVWDYSDIPLNILGQVCPLFSLLWFMLCIPSYCICRLIDRRFTAAGSESV